MDMNEVVATTDVAASTTETGAPPADEEGSYKERYERLQKVLGRQGQELGELRKWRAEQQARKTPEQAEETPVERETAPEAAPEMDEDVAALLPVAETYYRRYLRQGYTAEEAAEQAAEDVGVHFALARAAQDRSLKDFAPTLESTVIEREVAAILGETSMRGMAVSELMPDLAGVSLQAWRAQDRETQRLVVTTLAKARLADKMLAGDYTPQTRPPAATPPAVNLPSLAGRGAVDARTQTLRDGLRTVSPNLTDDQLDAAIARAREKGRL